jgi:hypothetical protein
MLLFSITTAVRSGSSHILRWSDLFMSEIPIDDVCLGKKVPVSHEIMHSAVELNQLCHRSWLLLQIMQNTTSRATLMSMAHLDTG